MQKTKFKISGLKCDSCVILIEDRLKEKPGIIKLKIDRDSNRGVVIYDGQKITEKDIYEAVRNINNFQLEKIEQPAEEYEDQNSPVKKVKFRINGIKCGNCVILIEGRLKNKPGIVKVKVDQNSSKGVVIYDKQKINEGEIYKTIEEIGEFRVEKIDQSINNAENDLNYSNPELEKETKPPITVL